MKKKLIISVALTLLLSVCLTSCSLFRLTLMPTDDTTALPETAYETSVADDTVTETEETAEETADEETAGEETTACDDGVVRGEGIYTFCYTDADKEALNAEIDALRSALEAGGDAQAFRERYDAFEDGAYALMVTNYAISESDSYTYYNEKEIKDRFLDMSTVYNDTMQRVLLLYKDVYNSEFSDVFFADWSENDVRIALKLADGYSDEFSALRVRYDQIKSEFNEIQSSENFLTASAELYMEAIEVNNRMAEIMGYDNYMDYAFDVYYERDYTPSDARAVTEYVKEYIVPMFTDTVLTLGELLAAVGLPELVKANDYIDGHISNDTDESKTLDALKGYLKAVGGDMSAEFDKFFADGNYIFASNPEISRGVAFTQYMDAIERPMCYFGPGYNGIYTVTHEFGHYYSFTKSEDKEPPIDLAEVHSQGNEWLYTAYLRNLMGDTVYDYVAYANLADNLFSLINCLTVYEFEMYVYTHGGYTAADLDGVMRGVMEELGVYELFSLLMDDPTSYWHHVTIENPGYYISYSVSLVPSLELYALALDDFDAAAQKYMSLTAVADSDTFIGKLQAAGLYSPLSAEAYGLIADIPARLVKARQESVAA